MNARKAVCGLVLGFVCVVVPTTVQAQAASDNPSVTGQLNDAKTIVAKIKKDAIQMQSYAQTTGLSWQTHSTARRENQDGCQSAAAEHARFTITQNRSESLATGSNRPHHRSHE